MNSALLTRLRSKTGSLFQSIQVAQEIPKANYYSRNLIRSVSKRAQGSHWHKALLGLSRAIQHLQEDICAPEFMVTAVHKALIVSTSE